eukprot:TRINITY_DN37749_c0_g1_i1.p1 TRINITY_DN37749_c0_g1~~TRINITY_DN37749_c0_g1_i1.p1  ORF type:complete len:100 (-),score=5.93 TRINITY_DN37749_c0_g1_i1:146-445(-)
MAAKRLPSQLLLHLLTEVIWRAIKGVQQRSLLAAAITPPGSNASVCSNDIAFRGRSHQELQYGQSQHFASHQSSASLDNETRKVLAMRVSPAFSSRFTS